MEHREKGKIVGFPFSFPLLEHWLGTSEEKMVANWEDFSPFSNDQTSSLFQPEFFMPQCPLEHSLEGTPTSPFTPHSCFSYNGEERGEKGIGRFLNNLSSFEGLPLARGEEDFEK